MVILKWNKKIKILNQTVNIFKHDRILIVQNLVGIANYDPKLLTDHLILQTTC